MRFSIIYSVDTPQDVDIEQFAPPHAQEVWQQTENDEQYDYDYLEGCWVNGSHRKWAAILDRQQFDEFVEQCGLTADETETMGSLGAPGFGFGWAPAVNFTCDDCDAIKSAYVTPVPDIDRTELTERDWERLRRATLSVYG